MPLSSRAPDPVPLEEEINFDTLDEAPRPANGRGSYAYGGNRAGSPAPAPTFRAPPSRADYERYAPAFEDEAAAPQARDVRQSRRAPAHHEDEYDQVPPADYDPEYADDAYIPAHGEEFYDEAPPRKIKPWMMVAIAAVAAVLVGTSGLFAYRAVFGPTTASAPPKTIRPEAGPSKMVPGAETKTAAESKRIQDRVGDPSSSGERIVSREVAPIDPNRIPQGSPTQRIPAGTVTPAAPFAPVPSQAAPAMSSPSTPPSTEPRRVRTVTVRADGTVVDQSRTAAPGTAARTGPSASPQVSNSPMALQGSGPSAAQPPAALPPQRPGAQSDNPWANLAGQPAPAQQQAALPPSQPSTPAPAPAIAVNTPPPAGSYVVQVAAQKTEADAQSSWQALQQKYGSVLGGQQATIRRVDLGERGVFYRAQVGPFSSRAQASEVCQSLKAAGGECVIQRN
jgi:cell division septation protein DedD